MVVAVAHHAYAALDWSALREVVARAVVVKDAGDDPDVTHGAHVTVTLTRHRDAAAAGASDGMKLAINIAAMLLAFVALIAMINFIIGWVGDVLGPRWTIGIGAAAVGITLVGVSIWLGRHENVEVTYSSQRRPRVRVSSAPTHDVPQAAR